MKLRTVLSELPIRGFDVADDAQLGWDMVVSPEWGAGERAEGVIRLGSRADLAQEGAPGHDEGLLLVYAQGGEGDAVGEDAAAAREPGVVYCWGDLAPIEFRGAFLGLVQRSGELGARRNQLFDCFLESYDMRQFAQRAAAVLENPVIISNTEHKILATAGTLPTSDDVRSVLEAGYITPEVERRLRDDGIISSARSARHSVLSERAGEKDRAVTSIIYHHRLEMGRFDVFEVTHAMTGLDLELVDFASDLAGIMIERLGAAGGRLGKGSSILKDVLEGAFVSEDALQAHLDLLGLAADDTYVLLNVCGPADANEEYYAHAGTRVVYLWRHRFEVIAHNAELAGAQGMLLDKRVVAMNAYDRVHGTAYLQTAVASVRFPGSPADAAEALSVHRNTYFYRVNKIDELFHLDLKDGDDRLAVSFAAAIMEGLSDMP